MRRLLRTCLLATVLATVWAAPAQATRLVLPETLTTAHFQVHYDGAPLTGTPVLHQNAGDLAGHFESAYGSLIALWGYPAPLDDGDGKIDVYVTDITPFGALGAAFQDTPGSAATSGYIYIDDDSTDARDTAAHELFHLIQFGIWTTDAYVMEGTAEWAAYRYLGFPLTIDVGDDEPLPLAETTGTPDMSLTCSGLACGLSGYEVGGYSRWNFYEYLSERFGSGAINDIFQTGKTLNDPGLTGADLLGLMLQAKGSTLADAFNDFTVANLTGGYTAGGLKGVAPKVYSTLETGTISGALAPKDVTVNHLAARFLAFKRGAEKATGQCYAATLTISVALPAGVGARPFFYWPAEGGTAIPLAVSGSTASAGIPWDTCTWTSKTGLLSLPNPSITVDGATFTVSTTLTVDKTRLATSTPPPVPWYTGPTVPGASEAAPTFALYGPETLRVSKKKRLLRLVVFSSDGGKLEAEIGGSALGVRTLRAGNNDLRFTVPNTLVRSLAARPVLRVTSLSSSGSRGATVTRKLLLTK